MLCSVWRWRVKLPRDNLSPACFLETTVTFSYNCSFEGTKVNEKRRKPEVSLPRKGKSRGVESVPFSLYEHEECTYGQALLLEDCSRLPADSVKL